MALKSMPTLLIIQGKWLDTAIIDKKKKKEKGGQKNRKINQAVKDARVRIIQMKHGSGHASLQGLQCVFGVRRLQNRYGQQ